MNDSTVKQPTRRRHRQQHADFAAAAGLAEDCDISWIAAEPIDIALHPSERRDQIEHPSIAGMTVAPAVDPGVHDGHDVRMAHLGQRAGFAQETLPKHRVARWRAVQHLQREPIAGVVVAGLVDDPHPPTTDHS